MTDADIQRAEQALRELSQDPAARELARERELARINWAQIAADLHLDDQWRGRVREKISFVSISRSATTTLASSARSSSLSDTTKPARGSAGLSDVERSLPLTMRSRCARAPTKSSTVSVREH